MKDQVFVDFDPNYGQKVGYLNICCFETMLFVSSHDNIYYVHTDIYRNKNDEQCFEMF